MAVSSASSWSSGSSASLSCEASGGSPAPCGSARRRWPRPGSWKERASESPDARGLGEPGHDLCLRDPLNLDDLSSRRRAADDGEGAARQSKDRGEDPTKLVV